MDPELLLHAFHALHGTEGWILNSFSMLSMKIWILLTISWTPNRSKIIYFLCTRRFSILRKKTSFFLYWCELCCITKRKMLRIFMVIYFKNENQLCFLFCIPSSPPPLRSHFLGWVCVCVWVCASVCKAPSAARGRVRVSNCVHARNTHHQSSYP